MSLFGVILFHFSRIRTKQNMDQNISEYGYFLRSVSYLCYVFFILIWREIALYMKI